MNHHSDKSRAAICVVLAMALSLTRALADVVLVPGHIGGTVTVGDETIVSMEIYASNPNDFAQQSLSPGVPSAPYDLTVNVPQGTTPAYSVQALNVRTRDATTSPWDHDNLAFPAQSTTVSESMPGTVHFSLPNPNYVEGTVTLSGTGKLHEVSVHAYPTVENGFSHYTVQYADSSAANALHFEFPVSAGDMRCRGTAVLQGGAAISLPDRIVSPVAGVVTCDWTIDTPTTGQIEGAIEFSGAEVPNRFWIRANGPTARYWDSSAPGNPAFYLLHDLAAGAYAPTAQAYLNNNDDNFTFPNAAFQPRSTTVEAGHVEVVDITACQAYIEGNIGLVGAAQWEDINFSELAARGRWNSSYPGGGPSYGGYAVDRVNSANGDFDLVVSPGDWITNNLQLRFYDPAPASYLNGSVNINDILTMSNANPASPAGCGAVVYRDFEYNFGSVTVNFRVEGSQVLSDPRLWGACIGDVGSQRLYYYNFDSTNFIQDNVAEGSVTIIVPQGRCMDVQAQAVVSGTNTTFGEIDFDVVGGSEVVIDIGGPALTVVEPEVGLCVNGVETVVSGTVTDDAGVASVTVNGDDALLDPPGGEGTWSTDFGAVIALVPGANTVITVATDTSGKTGSDVRTVYRDGGPPTLSWSPADGATTPLFSIDVTGTVSDDVGIDSVTVNGEVAALTPTGSPHEFSFSAAVPLMLGPNAITVAVTEETGCAGIVQVRQVTVIENLPPEAHAGGPYAVDEGASIVLDGSGSSDPDGDPIGFEWDFDYDGSTFDVDASGSAAPTFSAAGLDGPTAMTVAVRVTDDEGDFDIATAEVIVRNVSPDLGDIITVDAPVPIGTMILLGASFTDDGTPDTHTATWDWGDGSSPGSVSQGPGSGSVEDSHAYAAPGVYTIDLTVTDDDGGSDTATYQYAVVYDPDGSFVTGGGTIESPAGAYLPDPSLTGRASFGFVSKYQKGASVPSGHTEFQFHAAGMDFKSSDHEWLVVAGARAQFKGTGAIKGMTGSFGFLLTAIDGQVNGGGGADKFRIKIRDLADDSVIYDNQPGTADDADPATVIRSGSIVIHTKGK